jgi:hypothetical protein
VCWSAAHDFMCGDHNLPRVLKVVCFLLGNFPGTYPEENIQRS